MPEKVTHRVRSKSAPRGRSPDPRALKKAAARAKSAKSGEADTAAFVTPPPRRTKRESPSSSKPKEVRRISFGNNSEHQIKAENDPPKDMKLDEANAILKAIKDPELFFCRARVSYTCISHI